MVDLKLEFNAAKKTFDIPVLIVIEPARLNMKKETTPKDHDKLIDTLVLKGLYAQLRPGNLVTGQQFVALDFNTKSAPARITYEGEYPIIPTLPTQIEEIATKVSQFINKLDKLPMEQIGNDLKGTLQGTREIANSPEIKETLRSLNAVVKEIQMLTADLRIRTTPETQCCFKTDPAVAVFGQCCSGSGFSAAIPDERNAGRNIKSRALPAGADGIP